MRFYYFHYAHDCLSTSAEMAKELGTFPGYERNKENMLRVIRNHRRPAFVLRTANIKV
ncbi:MAG: hypothetical protein Ct9H300mP28_33540 [Pseudomonadota bacterium]|nr:MAG: hypothetical protein Ct9H300mP28_33540 [Pseudomonadota bacterium]